MRILGISCDYHDAAAALVVDGDIVAAAEEERFSRTKHDASLPEHAVASCLAIAGLRAADIDVVAFHEKPLAVLNRVIAARQRRGPAALGTFAREMPTFFGHNLMVGYRIESMLRRLGATRAPTIAYGEHHLSHAAAAFFPSPFPSAAILTIDGIGEWATATVGHGRNRTIDLLEEQRYPHSIGLLYTLATVWCGFAANDGEYKLMGLAPFGEPRYREALSEVVDLREDGSIAVDTRAVRWWSDTRRRGRLEQLFDGPPRPDGDPITAREADLARSVQDLVEDAVLRMARRARDLTDEDRVCLAGGVALNCVANGRLLREGPFSDVWVQPAASDAGSAIGAALWYWHHELEGRRHAGATTTADAHDAMAGAALGPRFSDTEVADWLEREGVAHDRVTDETELCDRVAAALADGAVVGLVQGRMEFGPRALGHRSILADPRSPTVQRDLNLRVKGRESFRPFAPAVLWEEAAEWFDIDRPSPYMLFTVPVAEHHLRPVDDEPDDLMARVQVPRSEIPACTHVDRSARVQTVHGNADPLFHRILSAFHAVTGCPVLLNTSFNRAGEPIVCTPSDALRSARAANLDLLVIESCVIPLAPTSTAARSATTMQGAR